MDAKHSSRGRAPAALSLPPLEDGWKHPSIRTPADLLARWRGRHVAWNAACAARLSHVRGLAGCYIALFGAGDPTGSHRPLGARSVRVIGFLRSSDSAVTQMSNKDFAYRETEARADFAERSGALDDNEATFLASLDKQILDSGLVVALARRAFYRALQQLGISPAERQAHSDAFIERLTRAPVDTMRQIRRAVSAYTREHLGAARPEVQAAPDAEMLTTRAEQARIADWRRHGHPALFVPPQDREDQRAQARWFAQLHGALLAAFVGGRPGQNPDEALMQALCRQCPDNEETRTHRRRAARLLRDEGARNADFSANLKSLQALIGQANAAAVRRHARLAASGDPVPAADAQAFARVALGDALHRHSVPPGESAYRNAVSAETIGQIAALIQGRQAVDQADLSRIVEAAIVNRRPAPAASSPSRKAAASMSTPAAAGPASPAMAGPALASPSALASRQASASPDPGALRTPARTVVRRPLSTPRKLLDEARTLIEQPSRDAAGQERRVGRARAALSEAQAQYLDLAAQHRQAHSRDPVWLKAATRTIETLRRDIAKIEAQGSPSPSAPGPEVALVPARARTSHSPAAAAT